jgi:hypothetical protein
MSKLQTRTKPWAKLSLTISGRLQNDDDNDNERDYDSKHKLG